jgi:hypothetical protein
MPEPLKFTNDEKAAYRVAFAPTATDDQWGLFINECERRALVPGVHVVFQLRSANEYNAQLGRSVSVQKVTLITTINALRLIADRSAKYEGHAPFVYYYGTENDDLKESKIPLGKVPHAVSVEGYRKDWRVPLFATARYDAYVQMKGSGNERTPTMMWSTRGEEQLAKCCEALMLRTVSPEECAGLMITEELGNDQIDREEVTTNGTNSATAVVTIPQPTIAPAVNQTKATVEGFGESTQITIDAAQAELRKDQTAPVKAVHAPVDPKPQPTPAPAPVVTPAPTQAPVATGLFANTTPPDPANETRVFQTPLPATPVATPATVPSATPVPAPAATPASGETPATPTEYATFVNQRATKIIRDKLKGQMKDSDAANGVKGYLLKGSNKTVLKQISAADFERLLGRLEAATPEQAAEIVKNESKA